MSNQGQFSSSEVLTAASLNGFSQVTILNTLQTVSSGTNTSISFSDADEMIDVGNWHNSTQPTRITPSVTGIYLFTAQCLSINNSNGRALINLFLNTDVIASEDDNDGGHDLSLAVHYPVDSAGDYISLQCFHNAGVAKEARFILSAQLIRQTS